MPQNEFETISYRKIPHINLFINRIFYRSFHMHREMELLCLLAGECQVNVRGRIWAVKAGDILLINHNEAHGIESEGGADFVILQVSNHMLMTYYPGFRTTWFEKTVVTEGLKKEQKEELWRVIRALSLAYLAEEDYYELDVVGKAAELLRLLYQHCPNTIYSEEKYLERKKVLGRVSRLADSISERYAEKMSLQELAEEEGLTVPYLSHFFREQFGVSFQEYVNNLRFENALRLMANPQLSINDIAVTSGFSDVKYMARLFRERFSMTPGEYRKSAGKVEATGTLRTGEMRFGREEGLAILKRV